jgi:hypothetical protein
VTTSPEIRAALRALEEPGGRLTAERVLEAARNPSSVLHERFDWDDPHAAEAHRLDQARELIRTCRITVITTPPVVITAYVRDATREPGEQGYRSIASLQTDEDAARATVLDEMARVNSAIARARAVAAALGIVDALEALHALSRSVAARVSLDSAPEGSA